MESTYCDTTNKLPAVLNNEREILLLVSKGDERAFRQVFDHYWNHIYSVAFAFTKLTVLSEEIVQDVFLKIWLKREQLPSVRKFDDYLFTVARNHIYNELRKKSFEQSFTEHLEQFFLETSFLPEQSMLAKETSYLIDKAIAQLPDQQRTVFELSRNNGFNYSQIADKMGISKFTVKNHMVQALRSLRRTFQSSTGEAFYFLLIMLALVF